MLQIPELTDVDVVWGSVSHLPARKDLPEDFQHNWHGRSNPFCYAISTWFYNGAHFADGVLTVDGVRFVPKPGVDPAKALKAISAALGSFKPSHEHKIGGCGFMLSEWFEIETNPTS